MKKFVLALVGLTMLATPAAAAIEVEGDVYAGIYDKYMWRGFNLSESQPVLQLGTDVSAKGFTLSYWSNIQLSSGATNPLYKAGEVTETDIILDYTFDATERLSVSVGNILYSFNAPGKTQELYLSLGLGTILAPSFTIYYDYDAARKGATDGSDLAGMYYTLAIGHDFELSEKVALSLGAALNYNDESPFVGEYSELHTYDLGAAVSYAVNDQVSIDASVTYSDPIDTLAEVAIGSKDGESAGGVNITLAF